MEPLRIDRMVHPVTAADGRFAPARTPRPFEPAETNRPVPDPTVNRFDRSGAGRDLPEVAVRVAEVPGVPPLSGCCFPHHTAAGGHGVRHDLVHGFARGDDVMQGDAPESGS